MINFAVGSHPGWGSPILCSHCSTESCEHPTVQNQRNPLVFFQACAQRSWPRTWAPTKLISRNISDPSRLQSSRHEPQGCRCTQLLITTTEGCALPAMFDSIPLGFTV